MDANLSSVVKQGILRKVKPKLKGKYFVLHRDARDQPSRLEYYDSLKNWEARKKPKKAIILKSCFSVNQFANSKVEYGMALYTKDDCFQVGFEDESERDSWLQTIRALYTAHRDSRPFFEHVWNVKIRERGLGKDYEGEYRLCLKDRNVMFFKKTAYEATLAFPLEVIRHCGHTDNFFKLEVGRQAVTGPGEFWLEVDDELIAANVHQTLITVMNAPKDEDAFRPSTSSMSSKDRTSFSKGSMVSKSSLVSSKPSSTASKSGSTASKSGSTASKTASTTGGYSTARDRQQNGSMMRTKRSHKSPRNRSDSMDSKSTLNSIQPSVSSSSIPAGSLRSIDNVSASLGDSRGSTPVRSLTPDPTLVEPEAGQPPSYMEMLPYGPQSNDPRSSSISSSSIHSWVSCKDVLDGSGAARSFGNLNAPSGSHADIGSSHQGPLTSQTVAARLSIGKRPERTQSYFSQTDDQPEASAGKGMAAGDSPYFEMLPQAGKEDTGCDPYFEMIPIATKEPSAAVADASASDMYFEMAPAAMSKSPATDHPSTDMCVVSSEGVEAADPYMDMVPVGNLPDTSLPYIDMVAGSSLDRSDTEQYTEIALSPYIDMVPVCQSKDSLQVDTSLRPVSSLAGTPDSGSLAVAPSTAGQPSITDTSYIDTASLDGKGLKHDFAGQSWNPYIDMSGKEAHGSSQDGLRLEDVQILPLRHYSVGSRPTAVRRQPAQQDQYVEMCRSTDMSAKSRSVPHLMPLSLASNPDLTHLQEEYPSNHPSKAETLVMMSCDKFGASNESLKLRPRGNTWSSPCPSLYSQKRRLGTKSNSSRESLQSTCSDYIDMQMGSRSRGSEYVEMGGRSVRHNRKHSHPMETAKQSISAKLKSKLSPPKPSRSGGSSPSTLGSAKSNSHDALSDRLYQSDYVSFMPDEVQRNPSLNMVGRRMSQPHQRIEPFPELSNSSEDETGMRSAASSFSSTRSSSSSRSSLARSDVSSVKNSFLYAGGSQVDSDPYIDCQPAVLRGSSSSQAHTTHSAGIQLKSTRVPSFISDEPAEMPKPKPKQVGKGKREQRVEVDQSYVDMVPASAMSAEPGQSQSKQALGHSSPILPRSRQLLKKSSNGSSKVLQPTSKASSPNKTRRSTPAQSGSPSQKKTTVNSGPPPQEKAEIDPGLQSQSKTPRNSGLPSQKKSAVVSGQPSQRKAPVDKVPVSQSPSKKISHPYELPNPPPLTQSLPLPSQHVTSTYALMGPQSIHDPYLMMEAPSRPVITHKPDAVDEKFQNRLVVDLDEKNSAAYSEMALQSVSTGTGSSGDSNHTLQLDDLTAEDSRPSMDSPYSLYSKPLKIPNAVPCYIRQNSGDVSIYPSPSVPAACYIRSESNLSCNSEFESISPLNSRETQDAILDSLTNAQPEDLSAVLRQDASSPCRFASANDGTNFSTYSRSNSDSSSIPNSAAELDRQQKKKLELVQEEKESCGSKEGSAESFPGSKEGSASSGKEIGAQVPAKCYIRDDPKPPRTRNKVPSTPAPALPVRGISSEEKALRLSASAEPSDTGPIIYVDLTHENAPVTSPPTSATGMTSAAALARTPDGAIVAALATANATSDVNYTTIDIEKTLELGKKAAAGLLPS